MSSTYNIVLTGGLGCGKTTATRLFKEKNVPTIDADDITKALIHNPLIHKKIIRALGRHIVNKQGQLERKKMRQALLFSPKKRAALEKILHPPVWKKIQAFIIQQCHTPYCIITVPLFFETQHPHLFHRTLVIDTPEHLRIRRVKKRSQWSLKEIKTMLNLQVTRQQRCAYADDIINNIKSLQHLSRCVEQLHEKYHALL